MSIQAKMILAMIAAVVASCAVAISLVMYHADRSVRAAGLNTAKALAQQVGALRSFYSSKVVEAAQAAGARVHYDFSDEKTIPLPATMVKFLGSEIEKAYPGFGIKLYSDYPFPSSRAAVRDAFEQAAIEAVEKTPDEAFHRLEEVDGRPTMRYAIADVMRESCVKCHNSHPESPKTDWEEGDVRGVISISVPVDDVRSEALQAAMWQGLALVVSAGVLILLGGLFMQRIATRFDSFLTTVTSAASDIDHTVHDSSRLANEQAAALTETMTTMKQLEASSQLSAEQADNGARQANEAMELADDGAVRVREALDAMRKLREDVASYSRKIESLSERISRIGEISNFVGELANQTNLLAMNAAVEAAHAGRHGQGFGVVAKEIRKLADRSTKQVSRIQELVKDIQSATLDSVKAAEAGHADVAIAEESTAAAAQVFQSLEASTSSAAESVHQISLNNKQQVSGINQVVLAVEALDQVAQESAHGMRVTADSLRSLRRLIDDLHEALGHADAAAAEALAEAAAEQGVASTASAGDPLSTGGSHAH